MDHGVLERAQEVLLELEVGQFLFLQEPHGQLAESVQSEERNMGVIVATDLSQHWYEHPTVSPKSQCNEPD